MKYIPILTADKNNFNKDSMLRITSTSQIIFVSTTMSHLPSNPQEESTATSSTTAADW